MAKVPTEEFFLSWGEICVGGGSKNDGNFFTQNHRYVFFNLGVEQRDIYTERMNSCCTAFSDLLPKLLGIHAAAAE